MSDDGFLYVIKVPMSWVKPLEDAARSHVQLVENFIVGCIGEELSRIEAEEHEHNSEVIERNSR